jgi:hypothetical protein
VEEAVLLILKCMPANWSVVQEALETVMVVEAMV